MEPILDRKLFHSPRTRPRISSTLPLLFGLFLLPAVFTFAITAEVAPARLASLAGAADAIRIDASTGAEELVTRLRQFLAGPTSTSTLTFKQDESLVPAAYVPPSKAVLRRLTEATDPPSSRLSLAAAVITLRDDTADFAARLVSTVRKWVDDAFGHASDIAFVRSAEPIANVPAATPAPAPTARPATTTIVYQTINQPVIERFLSEKSPAGVSVSELDSRLAALDQSLRQLIARSASPIVVSGPSAPVSVATFASSQHIDNLANVTITNATVHGVFGLTTADIPALNYFPATTTVSISFGGTGTSTAPTYGQLLVGNALGTYDLLATSSLGIAGGGGGTWGSISGTLSNQSDLQAALDGKLGLSAWYATSTDGLAEGAVRKYWSNELFDNRLSATTSLPSITTLANLSLPATQLTNFGTPFYAFFSATNTDALAQGSTNRYFADSLVQSFVHASTTIPKTYSANVFTGANTFSSALTFSGLNGPLDARNGIVGATSSIGVFYGGTGATTASGARASLGAAALGANSDITSLAGLTTALSVGQGGTGWAAIQSGAVPYGNGSSRLATTTGGTAGYVLAFLNGVPTWTATSTLSTISGSLSGTQLDGVFSSNGLLARTTTGTYASRTLTGTTNQITIANGDGASGNPTLSLPSLLALTQASSTQQSILDALYVGRTATTTIRGDGTASTLPYASTTALTVSGTAYFPGSGIWNSSGNVGIGTTSPWRSLSVNGSSDLGINALAGYFTATSTTASVFPYASTTAVTVSGTAYFPGSGIWNSSGNVGIGTTSPSNTLSVSGTSYFTGNMGIGARPNFLLDVKTMTNGHVAYRPSTDFYAATTGTVLQGTNDAGSAYSLLGLEASTLVLNGLSGGNVGIGTTSPIHKLDIYEGSVPGDGIGSKTMKLIAQNPGISFGYNLTTLEEARIQVFDVAGNKGAMAFFTQSGSATADATEKMRITADGNVGIGITGPTNKFVVATDGNVDSVYLSNNASSRSSGTNLMINNAAANSSAYYFLGLFTSNLADAEFYMRADGNAYADGSWNGGGADYAEYVLPKPGTTPSDYPKGSLICLKTSDPDTYGMCDGANDSRVVGIISTNPAVVGNSPALNINAIGSTTPEAPREDTYILLSMLGRVPSRVNLDGGPIAIGDRLAASSHPGFAMKATATARTVGFALESYDGSAPSTQILTYIQPELSFAGLELESIADIANLDAESNFLTRLFARFTDWFASAANGITDFFAKRVHTDELCVEDICVTRDQFAAMVSNSGVSSPAAVGPPAATPLPTVDAQEPDADLPEVDAPPTAFESDEEDGDAAVGDSAPAAATVGGELLPTE